MNFLVDYGTLVPLDVIQDLSLSLMQQLNSISMDDIYGRENEESRKKIRYPHWQKNMWMITFDNIANVKVSCNMVNSKVEAGRSQNAS